MDTLLLMDHYDGETTPLGGGGSLTKTTPKGFPIDFSYRKHYESILDQLLSKNVPQPL